MPAYYRSERADLFESIPRHRGNIRRAIIEMEGTVMVTQHKLIEESRAILCAANGLLVRNDRLFATKLANKTGVHDQ